MLMTRKSHLLLRLAVCGNAKFASIATSGGKKRQGKHQQVGNIQGKCRRPVGRPFVF